MPWWEYVLFAPLIAAVVVVAFAVGLAAAFVEGALLGGENPRDRWARIRFAWTGAWHLHVRPMLGRLRRD